MSEHLKNAIAAQEKNLTNDDESNYEDQNVDGGGDVDHVDHVGGRSGWGDESRGGRSRWGDDRRGGAVAEQEDLLSGGAAEKIERVAPTTGKGSDDEKRKNEQTAEPASGVDCPEEEAPVHDASSPLDPRTTRTAPGSCSTSSVQKSQTHPADAITSTEIAVPKGRVAPEQALEQWESLEALVPSLRWHWTEESRNKSLTTTARVYHQHAPPSKVYFRSRVEIDDHLVESTCERDPASRAAARRVALAGSRSAALLRVVKKNKGCFDGPPVHASPHLARADLARRINDEVDQEERISEALSSSLSAAPTPSSCLPRGTKNLTSQNLHRPWTAAGALSLFLDFKAEKAAKSEPEPTTWEVTQHMMKRGVKKVEVEMALKEYEKICAERGRSDLAEKRLGKVVATSSRNDPCSGTSATLESAEECLARARDLDWGGVATTTSSGGVATTTTPSVGGTTTTTTTKERATTSSVGGTGKSSANSESSWEDWTKWKRGAGSWEDNRAVWKDGADGWGTGGASSSCGGSMSSMGAGAVRAETGSFGGSESEEDFHAQCELIRKIDWGG